MDLALGHTTEISSNQTFVFMERGKTEQPGEKPPASAE